MSTHRFFTFAALRLLGCNRAIIAMICAVAALSAHGTGATDDRDFAAPQGRYAFTIGGSTNNVARAIAIQPDGKIVMVGTCGNGNGLDNDFCVARLTASGVLDPTFVGPSGAAGGSFVLPIGAGSDLGTAVAVQPDGKIVLAGSCNGPANDDFCLARLNSNGSLDVTFNGPDITGDGEGTGQGKFLLRVGNGHDTLAAMALQPDGKIVLVGSCADAVARSFCVARLLSNGARDNSLVDPNTNFAAAGRFSFRFVLSTESEDATALAVQPDGKILVVGTCNGGATNLDFCAARFLSNGAFDTDFDGGNNIGIADGNGKIKIFVSSGSRADLATAVVVRPNADIIIAGVCQAGATLKFLFCAHRLEGGRGRSISNRATGFPGTSLDMQTSLQRVTALSLQHDGKFILSGTCNQQFCVARYNADFTLDLTYDGDSTTPPRDGRFSVPPILADDYAHAAAIQSTSNVADQDESLVIAGACQQGTLTFFCVTRLTHGDRYIARCQFDLDGDDRNVATIDGLMMTRIMLGLTGSAVTSGITFPVNARRNTWASIRLYLASQCGLSLPL